MTSPQGNNDSGGRYRVPRILPPHIFALSALGVYFFGRLETGYFSVNPWGAGLMVLALAAALAASMQFKRAHTTIFPGDRPTQMVTTGMFRYSRNPMYTAMAAFLLGFWSWTGGFSPLAVIIVFVAIIQNRFIAMEERHMLQEFGEEYLKYCMQVRRWV